LEFSQSSCLSLLSAGITGMMSLCLASLPLQRKRGHVHPRLGPPSFCLLHSALGLHLSQDPCAVPAREFPFPVAWPVPGLGPQVRHWEVFPTPTAPLTSAQPFCLRRAWLYFSIPLAQKQLCAASPWSHPTPQLAWDGRWVGTIRAE
jgi:hypothetical protein